jgi:ParB family chromosome partitioning protein
VTSPAQPDNVTRLINRRSPADKSYVQKPILIPLADLHEEPPFNDLFMITREVFENVKDDMLVNGYDPARPVVVWKGKGIIVDGHTRLKAARELVKEGHKQFGRIPVIELPFKDDEAALDYAIHAQTEQRNLDDADIFRLVEKLNKLSENWGGVRQKARFGQPNLDSRKPIADVIGISKNKVSDCRKILRKAQPDVIEAVRNGWVKIYDAARGAGKIEANAAARKTREKHQEEVRRDIWRKLDHKTLCPPGTSKAKAESCMGKAVWLCTMLSGFRSKEFTLEKIVEQFALLIDDELDGLRAQVYIKEWLETPFVKNVLHVIDLLKTK